MSQVDPTIEQLLDRFEALSVELDSNMSSSDFANSRATDPGKRVFIMGSTGAGKSTFVSRLGSNLEAAAFHRHILSGHGSDDPLQIVRGFNIGKGVSTTKVPNTLVINGKFILFDMPGFRDTSLTDAIVIELVQKCFLTTVNQGRILILVNSADLTTANPSALQNNCIKPISDLFKGIPTQTLVDSLKFVFTRQDVCSEPKEVLMQNLASFIDASMGVVGNPETAVLHRMKTHSVFVDYSRDSREELISKIEGLLNKKSSNVLSIPLLSAEGNVLIAKGESCMRDLKGECEQLRLDMSSDTRAIFEGLQDFEANLRDYDASIQTSERNIQGLNNEILAFESRENSIPLMISMEERTIEATKLEIVGFGNLQTTVLAELNKIKRVNTRYDYSVTSAFTSALPVSKKHSVEVKLDQVDAENCIRRHFVIDAQKVSEMQTISLTDKRTVEKAYGEWLLYNGFNTKAMHVVKVDTSGGTGFCRVKASHTNPFVMITTDEFPIQGTIEQIQISEVLRQHGEGLNAKKKSAEENIDKLKKELNSLREIQCPAKERQKRSEEDTRSTLVKEREQLITSTSSWLSEYQKYIKVREAHISKTLLNDDGTLSRLNKMVQYLRRYNTSVPWENTMQALVSDLKSIVALHQAEISSLDQKVSSVDADVL